MIKSVFIRSLILFCAGKVLDVIVSRFRDTPGFTSCSTTAINMELVFNRVDGTIVQLCLDR